MATLPPISGAKKDAVSVKFESSKLPAYKDDWDADLFALNKLYKVESSEFLAMTVCQICDTHKWLNGSDALVKDGGAALFKVMCEIGAQYNGKNRYHNAIHATDVLRSVDWFLKYIKLFQSFDPITKFAMLIAAACHDCGHQGFGNEFYKDTDHIWAEASNYMSPLENMHARVTYKRLCISGALDGIFASFDNKKLFRTVFMDCILKTDQKSYEATELLVLKEMNKGNYGKYKHFMPAIAVHTADISNGAKPYNVYWKWAGRVVEEFQGEGAAYKKLSGKEVPTSSYDSLLPMYHKGKQQLEDVQWGYLLFAFRPWWQEWVNFVARADVGGQSIAAYFGRRINDNFSKIAPTALKQMESGKSAKMKSLMVAMLGDEQRLIRLPPTKAEAKESADKLLLAFL